MTYTDRPVNTLDEVIQLFGMERHQTAGWFSPHYSDSEVWGRPKLSSAYFLLPGDEPLPLHKTDSIEVWHYYLGAPAEMTVTSGGENRDVSVLGVDLAAGERPQLAVPAYFWQSFRSLGPWTLLGCTMSPGYSPRSSLVLSGFD